MGKNGFESLFKLLSLYLKLNTFDCTTTFLICIRPGGECAKLKLLFTVQHFFVRGRLIIVSKVRGGEREREKHSVLFVKPTRANSFGSKRQKCLQSGALQAKNLQDECVHFSLFVAKHTCMEVFVAILPGERYVKQVCA